jgi:hypothetical protein
MRKKEEEGRNVEQVLPVDKSQKGEFKFAKGEMAAGNNK